MYLSQDIPNAMMYDAQTSIYDIAMTTYHPLMLKEHFRCVPEIIGYSNWLSYDGKILPLRSASSSNLLPAVVNYRVADGMRSGKSKINEPEAKAIVALMKACIEQPEYDGKTFGVISLLGADQARLIEKLISQDEDIDAREREERRILCGDSSNFQGDERDVIFLSMVDSPTDPAAPLSLQGFGVQDSTRKRYNVAASRARDQLWVINSLDHNVNLKAGDIRKGLIEYALDPNNLVVQKDAVTSLADSEFEIQVVMALKTRGYHIVQQWEVGAYRIDMVAVYGDKKVAIECDGDRYHSSPAQVRNDMERQTILERIGWTFVRIRGSEYFRQPDKTIERVVVELDSLGIQPESMERVFSDAEKRTGLLERVKHRAVLFLHPELETEKDTAINGMEKDASIAENNDARKEATLMIKAVELNDVSPYKSEESTPKVSYDDQSQASVRIVAEKNSEVYAQTSLFSSVSEQYPVSLQDAAKLLISYKYQVIDKSHDMNVLWVITTKDADADLAKILGEQYTITWNKRGMIQTDNKSFFSIRSK